MPPPTACSLLNRLTPAQMFYMHGSDMQHNRALLPDIYGHPKRVIQLMQRYTESSDFSIRHYKWITVRDWNDDLVISLFLALFHPAATSL